MSYIGGQTRSFLVDAFFISYTDVNNNNNSRRNKKENNGNKRRFDIVGCLFSFALGLCISSGLSNSGEEGSLLNVTNKNKTAESESKTVPFSIRSAFLQFI